MWGSWRSLCREQRIPLCPLLRAKRHDAELVPRETGGKALPWMEKHDGMGANSSAAHRGTCRQHTAPNSQHQAVPIFLRPDSPPRAPCLVPTLPQSHQLVCVSGAWHQLCSQPPLWFMLLPSKPSVMEPGSGFLLPEQLCFSCFLPFFGTQQLPLSRQKQATHLFSYSKSLASQGSILHTWKSLKSMAMDHLILTGNLFFFLFNHSFPITFSFL